MEPKGNDIDVHLGKRLRRRRRLLGLTQQQLAGACGVRFQQIQKYECGANRISASRLVMLADALGLSAADVLPRRSPTSGEARDAETFDRLAARIPDPAVRSALIGLAAALAA